jgi:Transmembrane secretion effector
VRSLGRGGIACRRIALAVLSAVVLFAWERRRDGAYDWALYEDPAHDGRFIETFLMNSWLGHLRAHERATNADRMREQEIRQFLLKGDPKTTHLVGVQPD